MIEILKTEYWSKADAFVLPLTGLRNDKKFEVKAYFFWEEYSIEDFKLILKYNYKDYKKFLDYCKSTLFPILDKNGYLVESYDCEGFTIFILDMGDWARDIEFMLAGKYSKMSKEAKNIIELYHEYYEESEWKIPMHIFITLYPKGKRNQNGEEVGLVDGKLTGIEYVIKHYGFSQDAIDEIKKNGELSGIYDIKSETLSLECVEKPVNIAEEVTGT